MRRLRQGAVWIALGAVLVTVHAPAALAHEQRKVGSYQLTVGWAHEPTYVGEQNEVQLFVKDPSGNPVDDLGSPATLQLTVSTAGQTSSPLDLNASFDPDTGLGNHGEFDAAVIPTAPGDYTFHFSGSIGDQKVDEKFTSGAKTFATVEEPTGIEFPTKTPTLSDLQGLSSRLSSRVQSATTAASQARDRAATATSLAVVGIAVGVVALLAGTGLALSGRRSARRDGAGGPS